MCLAMSFLVFFASGGHWAYAWLYDPPPPGPDYKHYKSGWDQSQADAQYDHSNGQYRDYMSGDDCQGHTQWYCNGYQAGYQAFINANVVPDQQNVAENNAGVNIHGNNNHVEINQGIGQSNTDQQGNNDKQSNGNGY